MNFRPCDVVLSTTDGPISRAIRWSTRSKGEDRSRPSHAALVVCDERESPTVIEALLRGVVMHPLQQRSWMEVWRPLNIPPEDRAKIVNSARRRVGAPYPYWRIFFHAEERILGDRLFLRRLGRIRRFGVCSEVVWECFAEHGYNFGRRWPSPDGLRDFMFQHPDRWDRVHVEGWS